jgi:formylglycine-generating enzyme required for sulfatase activity
MKPGTQQRTTPPRHARRAACALLQGLVLALLCASAQTASADTGRVGDSDSQRALPSGTAQMANPVANPLANHAPPNTAPNTAPYTSPYTSRYLRLPAASFRTVLPPDGINAPANIAAFALRSHLVSNLEYRAFLQKNPTWQRGQVPALFADADYLANWPGPLDFGKLAADAPVTRISWFAAQAFCASENARLPRFAEWEYAAAADTSRADARSDPQWLAQILDWYSHPASGQPGPIGQSPANFYQLYDIHNLVWEWVEDFNGLFVSSDSRQAAEAKQLEYCGGAALSLSDKQNYAILIRLALLAAMEAPKSGTLLGFRCARDLTNGE